MPVTKDKEMTRLNKSNIRFGQAYIINGIGRFRISYLCESGDIFGFLEVVNDNNQIV